MQTPGSMAPDGRRRIRKTRWTVRLMDRLSRLFITVAGIGTIVAVSIVFLFLVWTVVPLFLPGRVEKTTPLTAPSDLLSSDQSLISAAVDEHELFCWTLARSGTLTVFRLANGAVLERRELFKESPPTSASAPSLVTRINDRGIPVTEVTVAFGFADGSVRVGKFAIEASYPRAEELPPEVRQLAVGQSAPVGTGVVLFTPVEQFYLQKLIVRPPELIESPHRSPVRLIDQTLTGSGPVLCTLTDNHKLRLSSVDVIEAPDGSTTRELKSVDLPYDPKDVKTPPDHLILAQDADKLYLIWNDGRYVRYDTRKPAAARVVERGTLLDREGTRITFLRQLIGRTTLLVGDSSGAIGAWFPINSTRAGTVDSVETVRGHRLEGPSNAAVTTMDISSRGRMVCAGYSGGQVRLFNVTSHKTVAAASLDQGDPVRAVILSPRVDGIVALGAKEGRHWSIEPGHPAISLHAVFGKVWYEGYEAPIHKWESSSGSDAYEPKFGMVPLIFGTLKASFYSLLFGAPLALLAAIYTSEFMRPRGRAIVKPVIEMMASLPSVVLGFLAGLVFARFVEDKVPTLLCCFLFVPVAFIAVAQLTQLLPEKTVLMLQRVRFLVFLLCLPLGIATASVVGPIVERALFAGDLRAWLVNRNASSFGGFVLLFLPLGILLTAVMTGYFVTPQLRRVSMRWSRSRTALLDLLRFGFGCLIAVGIALGLALLCSGFGFDARGGFLGTYDQRNALVAGFAMGFAIIPIIYTLADDALNSVPQHLRSGSLATGATPWQTALRIVIPTAMSGLFSAVMIGFGRAVGETMIVVMASGNTPLLDWNIFNGFRTLSANIAVEIPEATEGSTLFATLFLTALVLFLMTFVLNTIAEIVRLRFRRRAYQL